MSADQTGLFYLGAQERTGNKDFPKSLKGGFFKDLEPRFLIIFGLSLAAVFAVTLMLSLRPVSEVSEKEVERIQQRYAELVLEQPEEEIKEKIKERETTQETGKQDAEEGDKEEVDRSKESVVEREKRKSATREAREAQREQVDQELDNTGVFAAITAGGGSKGGGSAADLLGDDGGGGLSGDLSDVSGGGFARKKSSDVSLEKREGKTGTKDIETGGAGSVKEKQVKSSGNVEMSSDQATVKSSDGGKSSRTQASINRVVKKQSVRLKRVYEMMLKRDPKLKGKIVIHFLIKPDGSVTGVSIVKSTMGNSTFEQRILRYIRRWRFSAVSTGDAVDVTYPFVFYGSQ